LANSSEAEDSMDTVILRVACSIRSLYQIYPVEGWKEKLVQCRAMPSCLTLQRLQPRIPDCLIQVMTS
jgi:hypothetical protein